MVTADIAISGAGRVNTGMIAHPKRIFSVGIAAAAIGGASLLGGNGGIVGTLLGAIILGAMRNGLTLLNVQAFYQLLATGVVILLAMLVDRLTRGRG